MNHAVAHNDNVPTVESILVQGFSTDGAHACLLGSPQRFSSQTLQAGYTAFSTTVSLPCSSLAHFCLKVARQHIHGYI